MRTTDFVCQVVLCTVLAAAGLPSRAAAPEVTAACERLARAAGIEGEEALLVYLADCVEADSAARIDPPDALATPAVEADSKPGR